MGKKFLFQGLIFLS